MLLHVNYQDYTQMHGQQNIKIAAYELSTNMRSLRYKAWAFNVPLYYTLLLFQNMNFYSNTFLQ